MFGLNASHTRLTLALSLVALAACADKKKNAVDDELSRDLTLATQPAATPQFRDTAIAPAPSPAEVVPPKNVVPRKTPTRVAERPETRTVTPPPPVETKPVAEAPKPEPAPAPAKVVAAIGAGTQISLASTARVCTQTNRPGDKFIATVTSAATGTNGAEIPAGTRVVIELATAQAGSTPDSAQIGFRVKTFVVGDHDYPAVGEVASAGQLEKQKIAKADPNGDKKKVIGGAIAGAILGQMMGKNTKSTIIGAAAGAAAGGIVAKAGDRYEACLPDGAPLRLTLAEPLVMAER